MRGWIAIAVGMLGIASPVSGEVVVRLTARATVATPDVRIGQIAAIEASPAAIEAVAELSLGDITPGGTRNIDASEVRKALLRSGRHPLSFRVTGAAHVRVQSSATPRPGLLPATSRPAAPSAKAPPHSGLDLARRLEAVIRRELAQRGPSATPADPMAGGAGSPEWSIAIDTRAAERFLAEHRPAAAEWALPERWQLGDQQVTLCATLLGETVRVPVRVTLARLGSRVVATRAVRRGERLRAEDVELRLALATDEGEPAFVDPAVVVGLEAARPLREGQPLSHDDLRKPPIVFRGSPVTLRVDVGSIALLRVVIANENGGMGDWIEVIDSDTRKPLDYRARVIGLQTAELPAVVPAEKPGQARDARRRQP